MFDKSTQSNHIQTPKSILKGFSFREKIINENGKPENHNYVYQMDMLGHIEKKNIKECNSQVGFYSEYKEKQLSNVETFFGDVKKKILRFIKSNDDLKLSPKEVSIIRLFYRSCMARSQKFVGQIKNGIIFSNMITGNLNEYIMQEIENDDLFNDYVPSVIINKTQQNFVLPQKCWYGLRVENFDLVVMPVDPKIAIVLQKNRQGNKNSTIAMKLDLCDKINQLNQFAIMQEFHSNGKAIYAMNKEDLTEYVDYIKRLNISSKE